MLSFLITWVITTIIVSILFYKFILKDYYIGKEGYKKGINNILFSANLQGLNILMNDRMKEIILPFPSNIHLHDFYISLIVEKYGIREYVEEPLTLYRQHSKNVTGVLTLKEKIIKIKKYNIYEEYKEDLKTVKQFCEKFKILREEENIIEDYFYILNPENSIIKKIYLIIKNKFHSPKGKLELIFKVLISWRKF
jgi:rhamnosyltransferase